MKKSVSKAEIKKIMDGIKKLNPQKKTKPKPEQGVRDMRQEAIDQGSHGAIDYFGDRDD